MENLEQEALKTEFLNDWYRNFEKLEAFLEQYAVDQQFRIEELDSELLKWISIQKKIKSKLPVELREKFAELDVEVYLQSNLWEKRYQQLNKFHQKFGHTTLPDDNVKYDNLKDWLIRQIIGKNYLTESQFSRLDALGVEWDLIITRDQRWEQMYTRLKAFYENFGHCLVPQKWEKDKTLANWVRVQRRMQSLNKLLPDRKNKLDEIKFIWHIQTVYDKQWQHYYQELREFYQVHGHCRVPGNNKHLTSWIENQRTFKKNNLLLPDREKQLNEIEFIWSFTQIKKHTWDEKFKQLQAFKKKHGHSFVPVNYKENKELGTWVATQRKLEATQKLDEAKKKKLSKLGFVWSTDTQKKLKKNYDAQWNQNFERLKIYLQVYGTCQVSVKLNPVLQRWTRWQRILFYQGKLAKERINKLNEIRFPWNVQEGYWMRMYEALTDFRNQFGHTRVPYSWPANKQLAAWVYRMKLTKAELSAQKVELLNMIGFDWRLVRKKVVSWEAMFDRLKKFKQECGHTRVPVKWPQDPKLGKWVSRMRQEKDKLNSERVSALNKIAFDWGIRIASKKTRN